MPSDSSGNYSLPASYLAVTGTTIVVSEHNPPFEDVAQGLTDRLMRSGAGPMTGPLKLADGAAGAPSLVFASATTTGMRKTTAGIGFEVSGTLVAQIGANGFIISDKAIALRNLYHPSAPSLLLGSDSNAALNITGAAPATGLIRLAVASTATFATGQIKTVSDVLGTTEANGTWTITVVDATHIDLQGSTFANAYVSGGTIGGGVEEISLGQGIVLTGSVLSAAPPLSGAQGLVINNNAGTPNTIIDIAADQAVMVTTGAKGIYASAVAVSINTSTTGANGLDTGARANSTCYNFFLISNGTTVAGIASLSQNPALPAGYTYYVRVGAMFTDGSGNFYRFLQRGNRAKYVVTPATNTAAPRAIVNASGAIGSVTVPTYVASSIATFVPPTATQIHLQLMINSAVGSMTAIVAPNANYGAYSSTSNMPPITSVTDTTSNQSLNQGILATLLLETQNIYVASSGGTNLVIAAEGWTDKVNAT